jgi:hypothetical protein
MRRNSVGWERLDSEFFKRRTIDYHPDVILVAVDTDFRLVNSDFLVLP